MVSLQVTPSELKAKANDLRGQNEILKGYIDTMRDQEATLAGKWEGPTQAAFRQAFQSDATQMDNFTALIEKYCATLEQIAQNYEQAEDQNTELASNRSYK